MNMRKTCVVWTFFCMSCMVVMLFVASNKSIVIADAAQTVEEVSKKTEDTHVVETLLEIRKDYGVQDYFCIILPKGIKAENVIMENRYSEKELWIRIVGPYGIDTDLFSVKGDVSIVLQGRKETKENEIILKLQMSQIYEYVSTLDGEVLTITWQEPKEIYETIFLIDPLPLLNKHTEILLQVTKKVQEKFTDDKVKLYFTGWDGKELSIEQKLWMLEELKADAYIGLTISQEEETEEYGIFGYYNEDFYIPDFGNSNLADQLVREITISTSNRARGLYPAEEDSILKLMRIPATEISLGFSSNAQEAYLLGQESYQEKIAVGIVNALLQTNEQLNATKE